MKLDGSFDALSKREKLQINRQREKLEKNLGSISDMTRLPGALFIVDIKKEHIAVAEARKLNIPIFAMVDTNSDPRLVDFVIPANDDASKSIDKVMSHVIDSIAEGLSDRKADKEKVKETKEVAAAAKAEETKVEAPKKAAPKAKKATPKVEKVKVEEVKAEETEAEAPSKETK
jgi:small subunit ribosomal protein S2